MASLIGVVSPGFPPSQLHVSCTAIFFMQRNILGRACILYDIDKAINNQSTQSITSLRSKRVSQR